MYEIGVVAAVIIALGEFAKIYVDAKYIPLLSMVLGIVAGIVYIPHETIADGVFVGILTGLAACKLYDVGVKPLVVRKE
ncbi:holin [Paenibacillus sp. SC116]|uniref:holin n=1 Tax=Paenibacillus sp. SC116 TaxID=2968986 RepID=UPI00215A64EC|nr:holin [Paenibacillus sp. SC116]MCR8843064.1 holin [Paenibacillus sp. SC116]